MGRLEGKAALVTGGTSGIGRSAALAFAAEGARVVVAGRDAGRGEEVVREVSAGGGEAVFVRTDISKVAEVESLVGAVVGAFGRLDCAFNNAATNEGTFRATADFEEEEFDRVVGVNLKGVWSCIKHEVLQMLTQEPPGGAIVNTSSVNGMGGSREASIYSATKAGVLALTKSAAQEYAGDGIRANALVAGAFRTPMLEGTLERLSPGNPREVEEGYAARVPLGRVGDPEEAARVAVWLCTEEASYVTGHSMIVDGGLTAAVR